MTQTSDSNSPPDLARVVTAVLEESANRMLRLDPATLRRLGEMEGKVVCMAYSKDGQTPIRLYLFPSEGGLRMRSQYQGEPHVTITGNFPAFARLLAGEVTAGTFAAADMQIRGDIELGQRFKRVMDGVEIDWEEHASHHVGDVLARKLGNAVRGLRAWQRGARDSFERDVAEYLQEESRLLPRREAVEGFMAAVDTLRADTDRLEKRIERLLSVR